MASRLARKSTLQQSFVLEVLCLSGFVALYLHHVVQYFWLLPAPSDPLQYLGGVAWGTTYAYNPWLDRITLTAGLALFGLLPLPVYVSGPLFVVCSHILVLVAGMVWAYRKGGGFYGAFFFGLLYNIAYPTLQSAALIFPRVTLIPCAFAAFFLFYSAVDRKKKTSWWFFGAGFFAASCVFSKAPAIVVPAFFLFELLRRRRPKNEWLWLIAGAVVAAGVLSALFISLYDLLSFKNMVTQFFRSNIQLNWQGRPQFNNAVSYFDVIVDKAYIPGFLGLLVATGAYRLEASRRAFAFAWLFIGSIVGIYLFSKRGYEPIPSYIYEGYLFACLGLAIYWGIFLSSCAKQNPKLLSSGFKLLATVLILYCVWEGLRFGIRYDPTGIFKPATLLPTFRTAGQVYSLGVFALVFFMIAIEFRPAFWKIAAFTVLLSFWGAAYPGGLAYSNIVRLEKPRAQFFYDNAPIFNEVPVQEFDVYIESWIGHPDPLERLLWVYRLFFDKKYYRGTDPHRQVHNETLINSSIHILETVGQYGAFKKRHVLTDVPNKIRGTYPHAKNIHQFFWGGIPLSVVQIR